MQGVENEGQGERWGSKGVLAGRCKGNLNRAACVRCCLGG